MSGPPRPSAPVNKGLKVLGQTELDDVAYGIDVEAPCSYVSCYENIDTASSKSSKSRVSLPLAHITVDGCGFEAYVAKFVRDVLSLRPGAAEEKRSARSFPYQDVGKPFKPPPGGDYVGFLADVLVGRYVGDERDLLWCVQVLSCEAHHLGRHRRGEEPCPFDIVH